MITRSLAVALAFLGASLCPGAGSPPLPLDGFADGIHH